jgi:hypothetical protein
MTAKINEMTGKEVGMTGQTQEDIPRYARDGNDKRFRMTGKGARNNPFKAAA